MTVGQISGCIHCSIEGQYLIMETEYWRISLAQDQSYLGRTVVEMKRHTQSLSDLTTREWEEFAIAVKRVEAACRSAFGAKMFNWSCMMNDAYKSSPPSPHVHWHCRPRYASPITFANTVFHDGEFGHHYDRMRRFEPDSEVVRAIVAALRSTTKSQL